MLKKLSFVFCTMASCLVQDIVTVPFLSNNDHPISQWSGQFNGYDIDRNYYIPGSGTGNGSNEIGNGSNGMGNGINRMGNGINGMGNVINGLGNGSNGMWNDSNGMGNDSNGMGNGSNGMGNGSNGMGNGSNGMGNGSNGMANGLNMSSGWINTFSNGANDEVGSVTNSSSGWVSSFNNGSNNLAENGPISGHVMSDEQWGNGLGGMSWGNLTNATFESMQQQTNGYPGSGYPSMYYQQYSQSLDDMQNISPPNPNSYSSQMHNHAGNMGNIKNPTGIQFQGCGPQSPSSTVSPGRDNIPVTEESIPVTEATIPVTEASADETKDTPGGKGRKLPSTITSNRKNNKH